MSDRDVIVWNLMVRGYYLSGNVEMGFQLFRQMGEKGVVSWNTVISSLAQDGRDKEALGLFQEMLNGKIEPDEATVVTVLSVCCRLGEVDVGRWIHSFVESNGLFEDLVPVSNALVDSYYKYRDLESASIIFRKIAKKNVVSWNAMIASLALNGKGELGVAMFDEMINEGVSSNYSTFLGVLVCCVHAGLLQRGRDVFNSMFSKNCAKPKLSTMDAWLIFLGAAVA